MIARPTPAGGSCTAGPLRAILAVALVSLGCHRLPSGSGPLWSVQDPAGDDHGDGELTYPARGEPARGELDLVALRALPAKDGVDLEVVFSRPVRRSDGRLQETTGQTLDEVARLGFYTLNVDLYVDVDRAPGSGRTDTLPGRRAEVDASAAWEKAIVLTPRPNLAHDRLVAMWSTAERDARTGSLSTAEDASIDKMAEAAVDRAVFFPTRVTVATNAIRFFVPDSFLPGGADAAYAYTLIVTGADLANRVDLGRLLGRGSSDRGIAILGIAPGTQMEQFGGGRVKDPDQPPIVDLLAPAGTSQEDALRRRPAVLPYVVPAAK